MEKFSVVFAKVAEYPKVRAAHLGDVHEGDVFMAAPFYLAGTEYTTAVGIDKNRDNQLGMVGVLAFVAVKALDAGGVKLVKKVTVYIALVAFWKQVKNITGRQ